MEWEPISEVALWDLMIAAEGRMHPHIMRFWEAIKISPEKWSERRFGQAGGGFWVVAIVGCRAVWYNDIEDGFNISPYIVFGRLDAYGGCQSKLEIAVQNVLNSFDTGQEPFPKRGPPQACV